MSAPRISRNKTLNSTTSENLTDTPTESSSPGVGRALRQASKVYNRALQEELATYDIGLSEYLHLRSLWSHNGLSQIELSQRIGIEKASSTAVLNSLEEKKLIQRIRNSEDKRRINVFLTPEGEALQETLLPAARTVALRAVEGFSESEVRMLTGLLQRLTLNLEGGDGLSQPV